MTDTTEYIEAARGRRLLLYIGVPIGVFALVVLDYFLGRETDALLAQLETMSLEQIEQENQRLVRRLYAIAGVFTVVWLIFSVIFVRNGLKVWGTERFPAPGTRTAFRTRVRTGVVAKRWAIAMFCFVPLSGIVFLTLPYFFLWLIAQQVST